MKPLVYFLMSLFVLTSAQAAETISNSFPQDGNFIESITSRHSNTGGFGRPGYGRPGYGSGGGYSTPQVTCSASDTGWEEHWSGHSTCSDCLRKHGKCRETCRTTVYSCEAQGIDYRGYAMNVFGRDYSRWDAERQALRSCQRYYRNCRVVQCTTSSETVSTRSCR